MSDSKIVKGLQSGKEFVDGRYGVLWEIVNRDVFAKGSIGLAWVNQTPHTSSPAHFHKKMEEYYLIVNGTGEVLLDGQRFAVAPGDTVVIDRHTIHNITAGENGVGFYCITFPPYDPDDDIEV